MVIVSKFWWNPTLKLLAARDHKKRMYKHVYHEVPPWYSVKPCRVFLIHALAQADTGLLANVLWLWLHVSSYASICYFYNAIYTHIPVVVSWLCILAWWLQLYNHKSFKNSFCPVVFIFLPAFNLLNDKASLVPRSRPAFRHVLEVTESWAGPEYKAMTRPCKVDVLCSNWYSGKVTFH